MLARLREPGDLGERSLEREQHVRVAQKRSPPGDEPFNGAEQGAVGD